MDGALWGALRPRGIPRLRESDVGPITLIGRSGKNMPAGDPPPKPLPLASVLTLALGPGDQLIFDAGAFCLAYSILEMDAEAGTEIELEYAQRYFETDRRPEGSYGRVNRYIARGGRQTYMSGDTFGFKYLVLRLKSGQATLHGLRLVNRL